MTLSQNICKFVKSFADMPNLTQMGIFLAVPSPKSDIIYGQPLIIKKLPAKLNMTCCAQLNWSRPHFPLKMFQHQKLIQQKVLARKT